MDSDGKPEIFNSDQGSQFTCSEFVEELRAHGIQHGRAGTLFGQCKDGALLVGAEI